MAIALVKVKEKFQITVPAKMREELHLEVGDLLEATVQNGVLKLSPKRVIDRNLEQSLAQIEAGEHLGPFKTAEEGILALRKLVKSHIYLSPRLSKPNSINNSVFFWQPAAPFTQGKEI